MSNGHGTVARKDWRTEYSRLLEEKGIPFIQKNSGHHWIIEGRGGYVNFWPGTGRWSDYSGENTGFGLLSLLTFIGMGK